MFPSKTTQPRTGETLPALSLASFVIVQTIAAPFDTLTSSDAPLPLCDDVAVAFASTAHDLNSVVVERGARRRRLAHGVFAARDGDRARGSTVPDSNWPPSTFPSIFRLKRPGSLAGRRCLFTVSEPPAQRFRLGRGRHAPPGQVPRQSTAVPAHLEDVGVSPRAERPRLSSIRSSGREVVLARRRLDGGRIRIGVSEVGEEAVLCRLDALEHRRDGLGFRWSRQVTAVLVDRLTLAPVVAREGLEHPGLVDVLVRRNDVSPAVRGIDRARVVEMAALEVTVVRDRRLLRDVGIRMRARRVTDADLLRRVRRLRSGWLRRAPVVEDRLSLVVPVLSRERARIIRPRILDCERWDDVVAVRSMARKASVEVGLGRRDQFVVPRAKRVADPDGVSAFTAGGHHCRYRCERSDAHARGSGQDRVPRAPGVARRLPTHVREACAQVRIAPTTQPGGSCASHDAGVGDVPRTSLLGSVEDFRTFA